MIWPFKVDGERTCIVGELVGTMVLLIKGSPISIITGQLFQGDATSRSPA